MKLINIKSLPVCRFAHTYAAPSYRHVFAKRSNLIEITYIKEGKLTVKQGDVRYYAQKGDVILNTFRDDFVISGDEYHGHHTVGFRLDYEPVEAVPPVIACGSGSSQIYYLIDEIIKLKSLSPDSENKISGLFLQLVGELEDEVERGRSRNTAEERYVIRAKQYIYDNITLPIKQSEVAEFLGITPEYLCSVFKKNSGETVIKFINRVKLEGIRALMKREGVPLYRAAENYGYSDPNYVSRLYVKYFGKCITERDK